MLLVYLLIAYGITNIVVFGSIFTWLQELFNTRYTSFIYKILTCPMCFSTWLGFGMSTVLMLHCQPTPTSSYFILPIPLVIFLDGCLTSGAVWLMFKLEDKLSV